MPAASPPPSGNAPNPLTVKVPLNYWEEVNFPLNEEHLTLMENADRDTPMFLMNAVSPIVERMTESIAHNYKGIYGVVGTPGVTPFGFAPTDAQQAKTVLTRQKCPKFMRKMSLNSGAYGNATGLPAFRDISQSASSEALREGEVSRAYGFDWYEDVGLDNISHLSTPLSPGAATVHGPHPVGTKTVTLNKATNPSPLVIGDVITFAGDSQQYVVTQDVTLGVGNTAIQVEPALCLPKSGGEAVTLLASHSINLAFHPFAFAFDSRPTRPSTSTDFNTAYPNAPWRLVSVTGANFTSTSDQGFEDDIYCDDGSSGSIITTYPGLSEARIAYKLNSSDGALPLYHTKLAVISPEQHTGLVLGGSFQWVGQLNQNDTLQPQVYVGAASGHFNLSPARFWCHLTY